MSATVLPKRALSTLATSNTSQDWTRPTNRKSKPAPAPPAYVITAPSAKVASSKAVNAPSTSLPHYAKVSTPVPSSAPVLPSLPAYVQLTTSPLQLLKKVYPIEFLLSMRHLPQCTLPPAPTPVDIIRSYNTEFEEKERLQDQAPALVVQPTQAISFVRTIIPDVSSKPMFSPSRPVSLVASGSPIVSRLSDNKENGTTPPSRSPLPIGSGKKPVGSGKPCDRSDQVQKPRPEIQDGFFHTLSPFVTLSPTAAPAPPPNTPIRPEIIEPVPYTVSLSLFQALSNLPQQPESPAVKTPLASVLVTPPRPDEDDVVSDAALDVVTARMKGIYRETDSKRLGNRQKQIEYGKSTVGYKNYLDTVPRSKRTREDPKTPNRHQICSKRSWDGQIRKWRRLLHKFDPVGAETDNDDLGLESDDEEVEVRLG
eukprot:TRINITY_DN21046_c0_g1_i1.p1 TRINITY_DN21046_c0_g1~~TRINITY_DN21046_c0_g1_i1.p1  ORF type:complete len:425 (+),score=86.64 TRINITY_DN21046_c0_g1_i1:268-1542(+)